jgi:uncharacterized protein (TIGR00255 family)
MALQSMTGFAEAEGALGAMTWRWELRSVNGRGLDLRYRGPDGYDGLEQKIRAAAQGRLTRGNVSIGLRTARAQTGLSLIVNEAALASAVTATLRARAVAEAAGLEVAPVNPENLLALRGVAEPGEPEMTEEDRAALDAALLATGEAALDALADARAEEGVKLSAVIAERIDAVETLVAEAARIAETRLGTVADALREKVAALLEAGAPASEDRLAQELALLAVKLDVREEIDRLTAHISAARDLLANGGAIGRKFDFLMQEFNREANTLCSKSASADLTRVGLDLKVIIDQMREQVQNVE